MATHSSRADAMGCKRHFTMRTTNQRALICARRRANHRIANAATGCVHGAQVMSEPSSTPDTEKFVLVLQGGGALGAYQAGAYEALDEIGLLPDWVAGISIGAINAAIIAGNPPDARVGRLRGLLGAGLVVAAGRPAVRGHAVPRDVQLHERSRRLDRRRAGLLRAAHPAGFRDAAGLAGGAQRVRFLPPQGDARRARRASPISRRSACASASGR